MPDKRLRQYAKYLTEYGDSVLISNFEYDAKSNLIFLGRAEAGTAESDSHWQIRQFTYDVKSNLIKTRLAGGEGNFSFVWNDRAGLEYK